jgi:glutamine synthetase
MPKPFLERSGSGVHVHVSLVDGEGHNRLDDGSPRGNALLRHAVAGMLAGLAESMPFFAPHIDAFRRAARTSKSVIACTFPPISRKSASRPCMR